MKDLVEGPCCLRRQSTLTFEVKFNLKSKLTPFWASPHNNSSSVQARITKFGSKVQNTLVNISNVFGGNWPMITSSNGNIIRVTVPLYGEFRGRRWIPLIQDSDTELWCFLDLRLSKRLSKQSRHRWFETTLHPLWRHCNVDLQGQIWLKMSNVLVSPLLEIHRYLITTRELWVPRLLHRPVSGSPFSAGTYIPRLFHGPDCFTVSTLCTYTDLVSRGYYGV